jgi:hypothetical protein
MAKFPGFHKCHPPPTHHKMEGERDGRLVNKGFFRWRSISFPCLQMEALERRSPENLLWGWGFSPPSPPKR